MPQPTLSQILAVASEAAYAAGRHTLAYFRNGFQVERKGDGSPVTIADRESEALMRSIVARHFPTHTIVGEEAGTTEGDPNYRWILDPIDGTRTFVRGVPLYGVLAGVEVRGEPSVGVIYMPVLDEMVTAAKGEGCFVNGRPARVSSVDSIDKALLTATDEDMARERSGAYDRLGAAVEIRRTWADCYGYVLVATGRAEIAIDPVMAVWDTAPLLPIIEEAGGRFTSWRGERTIRGGDSVATNGLLHDRALELLREDV